MNLSRHQGEPDEALARLTLVFPDGPASRPGRMTFETSVYCMHPAIEIALDAGDLTTACAWLECHDRWMAWSGNIPLTAIGHCLWARYHRIAGDPAAARERANHALTLASEPRQPLALLAAHRMLGELDTEAAPTTAPRSILMRHWRWPTPAGPRSSSALTLLALAELTRGRRTARRGPHTAGRGARDLPAARGPADPGPHRRARVRLETRRRTRPETLPSRPHRPRGRRAPPGGGRALRR